MFGKLDDAQIEKLLNTQFVGRIGCHADGITYVFPVSYAYDGICCYVHSYNGMKMDIMRKNPKVCFQVDETKDLANWQSVICWGEFEELTLENERKAAWQKLNERKLPVLTSETMHITAEWPFPPGKDESSKGLFFRIKFTEKTGRFEKISGADFFAT